MVGAGIYESAPSVAGYTQSPLGLVGIWALGGALSLLGALTYATLGKAYPESGGDYAYLKHAFGPRASFLFAWTMLTVGRPGNLGAMAYVFARYAQQLFPLGTHGLLVYAFGSIVGLAGLNLLGTREGKGIQNFLTVTKVVGLLFLMGIALWVTPSVTAPSALTKTPSFTLALIFVLFAYGGWNEIAFVAAEVKNPEKNLFRTLVLGTAAVTALYLVINLAFLKAVGFVGLQEADAVAHTIASRGFIAFGGVFVSALVAVSALGAIHGMIFSGARIYYAMGQDHRLFSKLGEWNRRGTPWWSIVTETGITLCVMALFAGSESGFESLVLYSTPLFYAFLALVAMSVFRLPQTGRKQLLGYPWTPLLFLATCLFMLVMSIVYAYENLSVEIFWSLGILAVGIAIERIETARARKGTAP